MGKKQKNNPPTQYFVDSTNGSFGIKSSDLELLWVGRGEKNKIVMKKFCAFNNKINVQGIEKWEFG